MIKLLKRVILCALIAAAFWTWNLVQDNRTLREELIRFHVIAASDSEEDQRIKLQVRDAVLASISQDLAAIGDVELARDYIRENLPKIRQTANAVLEALGYDQTASATFEEEVFGRRDYDTFSLPAGFYQSLKITLGEGAGQNWWCVAFPGLCLPAAGQGFEDVAAGAGFSDALTKTLSGEEDYEIRFFLLDLLGSWQGYFAGR